MKSNELKRTLNRLINGRAGMSTGQKLEAAKLLFDAAALLIGDLHSGLQEDDAATKRRKAKRRETEVDAKPPVKPVSVAKPSKPQKPKYNGLGT